MRVKRSGLIIAVVLLVAALAMAGWITASSSSDKVKANIHETLVGMNLTYYSIAGVPMNYTIGQEDIMSIEPTTYKEQSAWKVRVGHGLAWDLTMDANGKNVLSTEQLFRT